MLKYKDNSEVLKKMKDNKIYFMVINIDNTEKEIEKMFFNLKYYCVKILQVRSISVNNTINIFVDVVKSYDKLLDDDNKNIISNSYKNYNILNL